jgi:probable F420-dependent oxidoreductase
LHMWCTTPSMALEHAPHAGTPYARPPMSIDGGLALPQYDHSVPGQAPLRWETVVAWAQRAEACGLSSVWLSDHLFLSLERYGGPPGDRGGFEPLVALAGLARATATVRLGTLVLCTPMRPPGVVAKALATLDRLSAGRLTVGMGAGWFEPEFRAAGVAFEGAGVRLEQLAEAITVLRGAFGGGPFSFAGRHYRTEGLRGRPLPVQRPAPPIWVGGRGDHLLRIVARHADGWNDGAWAGPIGEYRRRVAVLQRACLDAGRDPTEVSRSVSRSVLVAEDEGDLRRRGERLRATAPAGVLRDTGLERYRRGRLVGTVEQVRAQIGGWEAEGVSSLVVSLGALPFSVTDADDLELLASAIR